MTLNSQKKDRRPIHLATSREGVSGRDPTSAKLGGITVWAPSPSDLEFGLRTLRNAVSTCAAQHLSITKTVLRKLVRESVPDFQVEDRLFSAVLGLTSRMGDLDAFVCASENDIPYRVIVHAKQIDRFSKAVDAAESMLRQGGAADVRSLEKIIFPQRAYNTWSSTVQVLAHLSYLGLAKQISKDSFILVDKFS